MSFRVTSNGNKLNVSEDENVSKDKIVSQNEDVSVIARMIANKHNTFQNVGKNGITYSVNKIPSGTHTSPFPQNENHQIQSLEKQLQIGRKNYLDLMDKYHSMCLHNEATKAKTDKLQSEVDKLTEDNKVLTEKTSGSNLDFEEAIQQFRNCKKKYKDMQNIMYKMFNTFPCLSYIDPGKNIVVPGTVIGFIKNRNGTVIGASVVVDMEIMPFFFAFGQFLLNYDDNTNVNDYDKVIIFCPGRLSNVNELEEGNSVIVKLITNPEPKKHKPANTLGIILQEE
tara:strand:- start:4122 stop:4967 length:846 start_codon:yes stop_codon:yes gene_type:complete